MELLPYDFPLIERLWDAAARESITPLVPSFRTVDATMGRVSSVLKHSAATELLPSLNRAVSADRIRFRRSKAEGSAAGRHVHGATMTRSTGLVTIAVSLDDLLPHVFLAECQAALRHECVHLAQRAAIGTAAYRARLSGYDCAQALLGRCDHPTANERRQAMRLYLGDPFEVMAYAATLADEWRRAHGSRPMHAGGARSLPVWRRYIDAGFAPRGPVLSSLLRQAKVFVTARERARSR